MHLLLFVFVRCCRAAIERRGTLVDVELGVLELKSTAYQERQQSKTGPTLEIVF